MKFRVVSNATALFFLAFNSSFAASGPDRFDSLLGTEWYGVYMQGGKAGYAELLFEKVDAPAPGWRTHESITIILNVLGQTDTMRIDDTRFFSSPGGELFSNKLKFSSITGVMIVEGAKEADEYIVTINLGGRETKKTFDYPVDYLDNLKKPNLMIANGDVKVADSLYSTYFEVTPPLTGIVHTNMRVDSVNVCNFNGVPTEVYTVSFMIPEMQFTGVSIIDRSGRELELNLGGGIMLKLEGEAQAKTIDNQFDILADNLIRPQTGIENPLKLKLLKLQISGIDETDIINSDLQKISRESDNLLTASIKKGKSPRNVVNLPLKPEEFTEYLSPTVYIQSDAEEIKSLAKDIIGNEKNSWKAAKKINQWVYENIEKQFTPDFSNALQTLHTRRGDCGEHSALAVALMRAAGIPARPVAGLVYWPPGEGFGYHAWVEAYVGQWVMMDPAWGEDLVNPTHVALTTGDLIDQAGVLYRAMGRVGIEILEAK